MDRVIVSRPLGWRRGVVWGAVLPLLVACGVIPVGGGTLNDPVPTGTEIYSGTFAGVNGNTVTGAVGVYMQTPGSYVLHLDGLTAPAQNNLNIVLSGGGQTPINTTLEGTSGSQNYSFSAGYCTFSSVTIHSTSLNQDIGSASLVAATTSPGC